MVEPARNSCGRNGIGTAAFGLGPLASVSVGSHCISAPYCHTAFSALSSTHGYGTGESLRPGAASDLRCEPHESSRRAGNLHCPAPSLAQAAGSSDDEGPFPRFLRPHGAFSQTGNTRDDFVCARMLSLQRLSDSATNVRHTAGS